MNLEEKIYSFEERNTVIGIGSVEPFYDIKERLESTHTPFVERDTEKRINPKLIRKSAKSIITLGLSYNKKFVGAMDNEIRGNMSIGSIGVDYHILVKEKLLKIKNDLELEGDIFVDTGALVDREVAKRCGIGFIGKSGNLINQKLGSAIYIGYMLVDCSLKPTVSIEQDLCMDCERCIKACPSGAIGQNEFLYENCISYLTQKKCLTNKERGFINTQIYGCDICQNVCPHNKGKYFEEICDIEQFYPSIEKLLLISNREFNDTYKQRACSWRGKKILQRNAIICVANGWYSIEKINLLQKFIDDPREDIREYLNWAIEKLKNKGGLNGIF